MRRSFPFGDNSTLMEKCNRISVEQELRKKYDKNEWQAVKDEYGVGWLETVDGSKADIFLDVMEEQHKETKPTAEDRERPEPRRARRLRLRLKLGYDSQLQVSNDNGRTPFRGSNQQQLPDDWV